MVLAGIGTARAQGSNESTVIAISKNGTPVEGNSLLQVGVHPLEADVPKFLVGLENETGTYVTIRIKDSKGKNIHRPIFFYRKSLVATFDMSGAEEGTYVVEISNKNDVRKYYIQLESKVVRTVGIKPGVLANLKQ
jgi:hypothetical protein